MRRGRIFKRCSKCGTVVKERACPRCGGKSHSWAYVLDIGPRGGRREQRKKGGFPTKAEAVRALQDLQSALAAGTYVEPSSMTVAQYLADWLSGVRGHVRGGTFDSYELHVRRYIAPSIGSVPLQQLTRNQVKAFYRDLRERGRVRGGAGLSAKTVHNVHLTLRKALADAVEDRVIARNPADAAHKLPPDRPEMKTWIAEQLRAFLDHVKDDDLYALWRVAATTGLRRGEVLGLRWVDIDLDGASLSVNQQRVKAGGSVVYGAPKTAKGRRVVALDSATVAALRGHRKAQMEARLKLGIPYRDEGLVFCHPDGNPIDPDGMSQRFDRHVGKAGLPRIRLHDLRHTHATLALRAGVHPKVVQERLGHSSVVVTLDTYSHAIPAMQADAAEKIARLVRGTSE